MLSPALFELAKLGGSRRKPITLNDDSALAFLAQNNAELMEKHKLKIVPASSSKPTSSKRTPTPKRAAKKPEKKDKRRQQSRGRSSSGSRHGSRRPLSRSSGRSSARGASSRKQVRFADEEKGKGKGKGKGKNKQKRKKHVCFWTHAAKTTIDFFKLTVVQAFRCGFRALLQRPVYKGVHNMVPANVLQHIAKGSIFIPTCKPRSHPVPTSALDALRRNLLIRKVLPLPDSKPSAWTPPGDEKVDVFMRLLRTDLVQLDAAEHCSNLTWLDRKAISMAETAC